MGRIRTIKPEFPHSESMGRCSRDARLLFMLLWTLVDDSGRARAASRMLASLLFPYDDDAPKLIDGWLAELTDNGSIVLYEVDGAHYLEVCNWASHQKIDRPSPSKFPPFDEGSRGLARAREDSSLDQGPRTKDQDQGVRACEVPEEEPAAPPDFLRFWDAYGRRGSRKQSLAAWLKLRPTPEMVEQVIAAATRYRGSVSAPNYQRHAERWIRDEGWNDTVPSKVPSLLTVNGRAVVEASKQHIPNMPLGAASCQCQGCVDYRSRRAAQ